MTSSSMQIKLPVTTGFVSAQVVEAATDRMPTQVTSEASSATRAQTKRTPIQKQHQSCQQAATMKKTLYPG
jgi:hypothetical protein